ncbi:MAG: TolC family protein [Pirellulales bacterium]|nr:TolC family protein [Pirellulales bacterium]
MPPVLPRLWPQSPPQLPTGELPAPQPPPLFEQEVIDAVLYQYPLLAAIEQERAIAAGEQLASWGGFDLQIAGHALAAPLGYYKNYRYNLGLEQPLWNGTKLFGGYQLGRGDIQPWYFERKTNEGGEFRAGLDAPLLRDRPIDYRRVAVRQAEIARSLAEPGIRKERLTYVKESAKSYWAWFNAGRRYEIARDLLDLALERQQALERSAAAGAIPQLAVTENLRLIATRRGLLVGAERKFQQAAIAVSLYYRDGVGQPVLPPAVRLPAQFPPLAPLHPRRVEADIQIARARRPELQYLGLQRNSAMVDLAQARNLLQPGVDAVLYASQDVGYRADDRNDKGPFELETGVTVDVPLQRRYAEGKVRAYQAKIAQLSMKQRYAEDAIVAEVRDISSAIAASFEQVQRAQDAVRYNSRLEELERKSFDQGLSSLFQVNLREQATAETRVLEMDLTAEYFKAVAEYRAALGVDSMPAIAVPAATPGPAAPPGPIERVAPPPPGK